MSEKGASGIEWISRTTAAERTGLPLPTIQYALRVDRIRTRPARGPRPTLDAASVDEWAAWYRASREQPPRPAGDWLTAAEAAEQLAASVTTIYRYVESARLQVHREDSELWVSQESVRALLEEEARWIFADEAGEILGCSKYVVARLVERGHLESRQVARVTPALLRASVVAYAPVLAEQRAQAERKRREIQRRQAAVGPPCDGQVWLTVATAALLMEMAERNVIYRIQVGLLPATKVGPRWWLRRIDVEQAAAARVFATRMDSL